jgi:heterodisulfide reductase subunit A
LNEKGQAEVNPATCKGCGSCVPACRSGAPSLQGFTEGAIMAQLATMW